MLPWQSCVWCNHLFTYFRYHFSPFQWEQTANMQQELPPRGSGTNVMRLFGKVQPIFPSPLIWQETPLLSWFLLGFTDSLKPIVSVILFLSLYLVFPYFLHTAWFLSFLYLSFFSLMSLPGHPSPFHLLSNFPSFLIHPFCTSFPSFVAAACVDVAAVRFGQKSRPGLLLLACPQWSVCCMCVFAWVFVRVGVCSGLGECMHTGWPASSQPAVRVESGIWSLSIGPAGIFQRLLSPPLFNISLLLGVLATESCLCCQHTPTV